MKTTASKSLHDNEKANILSTTMVRMRILSPEMQRLLLETGRIATCITENNTLPTCHDPPPSKPGFLPDPS
jgi:hypothetical protein